MRGLEIEFDGGFPIGFIKEIGGYFSIYCYECKKWTNTSYRRWKQALEELQLHIKVIHGIDREKLVTVKAKNNGKVKCVKVYYPTYIVTLEALEEYIKGYENGLRGD
jgi:23S rRNA G2445 N2-methylase RlmL